MSELHLTASDPPPYSEHVGVAHDAPVEMPRSRTGFNLFLLLTALVFLRPAEVVSFLEGVPFFEIVVILCASVAFFPLLGELRWNRLRSRPWSLCVIGLLFAIVASNALNGNFYQARMSGVGFLKILIYYLLLLGVVDSAARLRTFLLTIAVLVTTLAALALLQYYGWIDVNAFAALKEGAGEDGITSQTTYIERLMATGLFHDPNDFALILGVGIMIALKFVVESGAWLKRLAWLGVTGILALAVSLTRSRGGFLALLAGLGIILLYCVGWKRSIVIGALLLPLLFVFFGGRQTDIDLNDSGDTAQGRIHLWRDSLSLMQTSPVFGIGADRVEDAIGLVSHNSYVQAFTELGLGGGILFVGALYVPIIAIARWRSGAEAPTTELARWRPYVLGILATYVVGMFSLTRCYALPTYMVLGAAGSYCGLLGDLRPKSLPRLTGRLALAVTAIAVGCLVFLKVFVRLAVR